MAIYDWLDDGSDFGNANGLDCVSLDVAWGDDQPVRWIPVRQAP